MALEHGGIRAWEESNKADDGTSLMVAKLFPPWRPDADVHALYTSEFCAVVVTVLALPLRKPLPLELLCEVLCWTAPLHDTPVVAQVVPSEHRHLLSAWTLLASGCLIFTTVPGSGPYGQYFLDMHLIEASMPFLIRRGEMFGCLDWKRISACVPYRGSVVKHQARVAYITVHDNDWHRIWVYEYSNLPHASCRLLRDDDYRLTTRSVVISPLNGVEWADDGASVWVMQNGVRSRQLVIGGPV